MLDYTAIKDVVAICRDAEQGFRGASNAVKTPALKNLFERLSQERGEFADELLHAARSLNMDIPNPSGVGGMVHAGWMELKSVLSRNDERAILVETARGEEMSLKTYRDALNMALASGIREILQRQAASVQQSHDRIVSLRDGAGNQAPAPVEAAR